MMTMMIRDSVIVVMKQPRSRAMIEEFDATDVMPQRSGVER
jgi:hypothetical protein